MLARMGAGGGVVTACPVAGFASVLIAAGAF